MPLAPSLLAEHYATLKASKPVAFASKSCTPEVNLYADSAGFLARVGLQSILVDAKEDCAHFQVKKQGMHKTQTKW